MNLNTLRVKILVRVLILCSSTSIYSRSILLLHIFKHFNLLLLYLRVQRIMVTSNRDYQLPLHPPFLPSRTHNFLKFLLDFLPSVLGPAESRTIFHHLNVCICMCICMCTRHVYSFLPVRAMYTHSRLLHMQYIHIHFNFTQSNGMNTWKHEARKFEQTQTRTHTYPPYSWGFYSFSY